MNRDDLQELVRIRLGEARLLLRNGASDGAYHLTGLAVECALEACIARKTRRYEFPDKKTVDASYSHDLTQLLKTAGLQLQFDQDSAADPDLAKYWAVVKDWRIESRYNRMQPTGARDLYSAATNRTHGVLRWIRQHW